MSKTIALLITLDTKAQEADFLKDRIEVKGYNVILIDIGVVGEAGIEATIDRSTVISTGGGDLSELLKDPTREKSNPFVVGGCINILRKAIQSDEIHALIGWEAPRGLQHVARSCALCPMAFQKLWCLPSLQGILPVL